MKHWSSTLIIIACALFAGCSSDQSCDEPERYESARQGARVEPTSDLDALEVSKEMTVPKASPRGPRPEGSPCLELPPVIQIES
jgi:hypothetical protein